LASKWTVERGDGGAVRHVANTALHARVPGSGSGGRSSLVSSTAAVEHRRDAGQQAEEHQLGDHPQRAPTTRGVGKTSSARPRHDDNDTG